MTGSSTGSVLSKSEELNKQLDLPMGLDSPRHTGGLISGSSLIMYIVTTIRRQMEPAPGAVDGACPPLLHTVLSHQPLSSLGATFLAPLHTAQLHFHICTF